MFGFSACVTSCVGQTCFKTKTCIILRADYQTMCTTGVGRLLFSMVHIVCFCLSASEVGGKDLDWVKSREIAEDAVGMLESGKTISEVHSMVDTRHLLETMGF